MDDTLTISTESDGQQHKDQDPNTTTDESILTPAETNSNSTEPEPSIDHETSNGADKADITPKKGALKAKSPKKDGLKFDLNVGDNVVAESDLEEVSSSSDSEDDADVASSKAAGKKKKKKLTRAKSKLKTKTSKSPSAKEKKKAKQQPPTIDSDVETEESDSGDSGDDSDDDAQTPKVGLKKQVKALTEQLGQIQKQLAPPAAYPVPPFGAGGYYPAQGAGLPYGYGPAMPPALPSAVAPRPATIPKTRKDVDASRSRLESVFGSLSRFPTDFLFPGGYRGSGFAEDDEGLKGDRKSKKPVRPDFKRVDSVWDSKMHNFRLKDTVENVDDAGYDKYVFHVRRTFDFENKYRSTIIDIKSKLLRECLQDVIGNVKGFSLVDETPKIPPNMLFL